MDALDFLSLERFGAQGFRGKKESLSLSNDLRLRSGDPSVQYGTRAGYS